MKKLAIFTVTLLIALTSLAGKPIVIKGKIDNCKNPNNSYIRKEWFNSKTLQDQSKNFDFSIADDGTFRVKLTETDDYYVRYWIYLGNEHTHLDLIAGDSIYMTVNGVSFDESIKYSGQGAGRNNYRRDVYLQFWQPDAVRRVNYEYEVTDFLAALNALTTNKLDLLNKYTSSGEIDSSYYAFEKSVILADRAYLIVEHNSIHRNHKKASRTVTAQFKSMINAVDFTNDHLLQYDYFKSLVANLPRYIVETGTGKSTENLNDEIGFAKSHFSPTMFQYFALEFIRGQMRKTGNLGEKRALLSFFSQQFTEPNLKREIQIQRSYVNRKGGMYGDLFEATVIVTLFIIGFALILLLILRLFKIDSFRNTKINISLWMKVVFYLGVCFLAFAYIVEHHVPSKAFVGVLLWLGVFLAHTYILIPKYALNRDYLRYGAYLVAGALFFDLGAFLCEPNPNFTEFILICAIVYGALIALSWTSFYIHLLASRKSTFKSLSKDGLINLELAINIIVIYFINFAFIGNEVGRSTFLNEALVFYSALFLFYFHTFYSFPRYFNKEKIVQFVGINLGILLGASIGMIVLDGFLSQNSLQGKGIDKSLVELISLRNIRADILLLFTAILIPSFIYFAVKERFKKLDTDGFNLYRKKEAELAQLKAQVNPHFLFNTLNTLYAFALKEGSEKTAECIAKLANLMRFMLDDMEKETILLEREVSYIQDYVKLQSIRSAVEHNIAINVDIEEGQSYVIAPMLLIPFVENAFKHGMNPNNVSHLKIDITGKGNQIQFVIENSTDDSFEAYYKEKGFGIGIENVKSRLKYIYPNRHNISIARTNGKFIVILSVETESMATTVNQQI